MRSIWKKAYKMITVWGLALLLLCFCAACSKSSDSEEGKSTDVPPTKQAMESVSDDPVFEEAEMIQVCDGGNNERCLAATVDGTRFLIWQGVYPEYNLWVQNADGTDRKELVFVELDEAEAECYAGLSMMSEKLKTEQVEQRLNDLKKNYGSAANALMHAIWQAPDASLTTVAGEWALVYDRFFGYARVNMYTGETVLLFRIDSYMAPDGSVFCFDYSNERKVWKLAPNQNVPEEIAFTLPENVFITCVCPQTDGTVWMLEQYPDVVENDDGLTSFYVYKISLVHRDETGKVLRRVEGGVFDRDYAPSRLMYNEADGIGIVSCGTNYNLYSSLWIFGPEDDRLEALILTSDEIMPNRLAVNREKRENAIEYGIPLEQRIRLVPLGRSADGRNMLVLDGEEFRLLLVDIQTMVADVLLTADQLDTILNEKSPERRLGSFDLIYMYWNGDKLICCAGRPSGYVLRLPSGSANSQ